MVSMILFAALLGLLLWAALLARSLSVREYLSSPSRGGAADIYYTLMGSLVGGWMFFGLAAIGYEAGAVGVSIGVGYAIGLLVLAYLAPQIKSQMTAFDCDTLDDYIAARFGETTRLLVSLLNFVIFVGVLAAQFIAMTSYLAVVAPLFSGWLPTFAALVTIAYTTLAGYKGVVATDKLQFLLLSGAAIVLSIVLFWSLGPEQLDPTLQTHATLLGYGPIFLVGTVVFFPPTLLVRSDLWQRISYSRDPQALRKAIYAVIPTLLVFYVVCTGLGILARAHLGPGSDPASSGMAAFRLVIMSQGSVDSILSELLLAVVSVGVFAALISTADTNLNIVAAAITRALAQPLALRVTTAGSQEARPSLASYRWVSGVIGTLTLGLAILLPNIVDIMVAVASVLMVFLPCTVGALLYGHTRSYPAIISISGGILIFLLSAFALPDLKTAFLPGTVAAWILYYTSNKLAMRRH